MPRNERANAGMPAALTCADVRAREWDFVEGTLPIPIRAAVQTHMDDCEPCRKAMTLCRSVEDALLSASAYIPAAGDLRAGFYARLATQQRPVRRYGRPIALSALAAGVLAVALIRPAFQTHAISPPHAGETVALPSNLTRPVLAPMASPDGIAEAAYPLGNGSGLTEAQMNRLFASADVKAITPRQHRSTFHRAVSPIVVAVVDRRPAFGSITMGFNRSAKMESWPKLQTTYREAATTSEADRDAPKIRAGSAEPRTFAVGDKALAKDHAARFDVQAEKSAMIASSANRMLALQTQLLGSATIMPLEDGVSLDVIDQDRGFSNTTRVASDVEEQGGERTVHIEADGN